MDKESIKENLVSLVRTIFVDCNVSKEVIEFVDLVEDLNMDSITFVSLVVEIESMYGIIVPDDKLLLDNFRSFNDIILIIENGLRNIEVGGDRIV